MAMLVMRGVRLLLVAWIAVTLGLVVTLGLGAATGRQVAAVTTASMTPAVPRDALALTAPVAPTDIEVGDVISYRHGNVRSGLVLHRVVEVIHREDGRYFRTQGDANDAADPRVVADDAVEGRLAGVVPRAGLLLRLARQPTGAAVLVGVPLVLTVVARVLASRARPPGTRPDGDAVPADQVQVDPVVG